VRPEVREVRLLEPRGGRIPVVGGDRADPHHVVVDGGDVLVERELVGHGVEREHVVAPRVLEGAAQHARRGGAAERHVGAEASHFSRTPGNLKGRMRRRENGGDGGAKVEVRAAVASRPGGW